MPDKKLSFAAVLYLLTKVSAWIQLSNQDNNPCFLSDEFVKPISDYAINYTTNLNKAEVDSFAKQDSFYQLHFISLHRFLPGFSCQTITTLCVLLLQYFEDPLSDNTMYYITNLNKACNKAEADSFARLLPAVFYILAQVSALIQLSNHDNTLCPLATKV